MTAPSTVLFLALLSSQAAVLVLSPILADVARDFSVSTSAAGQVRTLTGLIAGATALAFGRFARGVALRDLLLAGTGLLALGSGASAVAPSFAVFAAAQVPLGVAVAVLVSAGAAAAGEWARPGETPRVLSWTLVGPAVAWVVGMPLVGLAAERSWRLSFVVLPLAASVLVAGALSLCRKEQLPAARPLVPLAGLFRERPLRRWALSELLAASAWAGTLVYAGALFVESFGTTPTVTGVILGGIAVAYLPGNFAAARFAKLGPRLLPWISLAAGAGIAAFGGLRSSVLLSALVLAALAFLAGARTLAAGALGLEVAGHRRLAVMGVRAAAGQFGYLVGAGAGGIALALGGYPALGALLGTLSAAAAVVYFLQSRRPRRG